MEVRHAVVSYEYMKPEGDSGGWIRLYRSVFFHEFADEPWDRITAWMYLVSLAAYKPYDAVYRRHVYHLERGQAAVVMSDFGAKAGWSKWRVKRFFDLLATKDMVHVSSDSICCILTVSNYDKYQVGTLLESAVAPATPTATPTATASATANSSPILTIEPVAATATATASATAGATQNKNVFKNEDQEQKSSRQKDPGDDPVVALYSRVCVPKGFPSIKTLTRKREIAIKRAIDTYGLERLDALFKKAVTSDFLLGRLHSAKYPGWKADFDFLLKPETLVHIDEGSRYFDNQPVQRGLTDVHAWDDVKGW